MAIRLQGLEKRFPGADRPSVASLDLEVDDGTVLGVVGRNGAGKSTLLRLVAGALRPSRGGIWIDGIDLARQKADASRGVGWVPDTPRYPDDEQPRSLLRHLGRLDGRTGPDANSAADRMLERVGLTDRADAAIRSLSQGETRRLALATAWLSDPPNLLYDEVTNGLDVTGRALWESSLAAHVRRGGTVLLTSHRLEEIEEWADRIVVLEEGRLIAEVPGGSAGRQTPRRVRVVVERPEETRLGELRSLGQVEVAARSVHLTADVTPPRDLAKELAERGFVVREIRSVRQDLADRLDPEAS